MVRRVGGLSTTSSKHAIGVTLVKRLQEPHFLETMKGLRQKLNRIIEQTGRIDFDTMAKVSMRMGHKPDTGRRALEPDMSPKVKKIKNNKDHIVAWVWAEDEQESLV